MRSARSGILVLCIAALGFGAGCAEESVPDAATGVPDSPPVNLLLITIDTLRADHVSAYGYERPTTASIDELARAGVLFRHPVVQRGGTWPSLTSILTSMYPHTHGVRSNGDRLDPSTSTLAEHLAAAGFATAAFLTNMTTARHPGFDDMQLWGIAHSANPGPIRPDQKALNAAAEWMGKHRNERFFVWLHLFGPHDPYLPDPAIARMFDTGYTGEIDGRSPTAKAIHRERRELQDDELAHIVSLYDDLVYQTDRRIGQLLFALETQGLADRTLVVVTSDHGEELYDHNFYFMHSFSIYDSVLRVPLVMRLPGRLPAGRVVEEVVQSIDIAPTLYELLDVPVPAEVEGRSLVAAIDVPIAREAAEGVAFSELGPEIHSVRAGRWHYIRNPRRFSSPGARRADPGNKQLFSIAEEELYDVESDPQQRRNRIADFPEEAARLRALLVEWIGRSRPGYEAHEVSPEIRVELEALGYLDEERDSP